MSGEYLKSAQDDEDASETQSKGVFWPFGTMPDLPAYLKVVSPPVGFIDMLLRGSGQVCFMNNPISGFLVIIALMIHNWQTATFGILSLTASTLTALVIQGYDACTAGLFGFNGILVGIAISMFFGDKYLTDFAHVALVATICTVFGMMSSVVAIALGKCFGAHGLPGLTLPFNICTLWLLGGSLAYTNWTMSELLHPHLIKQGELRTCFREIADGPCDENQLLSFVIASLRGVCEIYLANNTISAILMLVAFAICSPLASVLLLAGSAIGTAVGWFVGLDGSFLYIGLFGFNPALTAAGIGAGIFGERTAGTVIWGLGGAVVTALLHGTLANFMAPAGMPAFTLAFCFATLLLLAADVVPKPEQDKDLEGDDEESAAPRVNC